MMNTAQHSVNDYYVPRYIIEILTYNYCPSFLKMSIVKELGMYKFNYYSDIYSKIDYQSMNTINKLNLIKSVIGISKLADDYLISPKKYLIEPELIYNKDDKTSMDQIKLLFYPDQTEKSLEYKISKLIASIKDKYNKQESEVMDAIGKMASVGDWVKIDRFIDKNIDRLLN